MTGPQLRRPVLSRTAEYALAAVIHLAELGPGAARTAEELAGALRIPESYLSKTLRSLARAGVLVSIRGRHGGFTLAVPPHELSIETVIAPFGDTAVRHCLLGKGICSDRTACSAHHAWKATSEQIARFFRERTVAEVCAAT